MQSLEFYSDYFISLFGYYRDDFFKSLANPQWGNHVYLMIFILAGFYFMEVIVPWRKKQLRFRTGFGLDVFYNLFNYFIFWWLIGGFAICEVTAKIFNDAIMYWFGIDSLQIIHVQKLPKWTQLVILFLLQDFFFYAVHRFLHNVDFLWQFHKVHHSPTQLDILNAARAHWVEQLIFPFLMYIPVGLIGFSVLDTYIVWVFINVFSLFIPTNLKIPLGPLKYIFNNLQMHIWHHSKEMPRRKGANFGESLSLWDYIFWNRLFPKHGRNIELGFNYIEDFPKNYWTQMLYPFKRIWRKK